MHSLPTPKQLGFYFPAEFEAHEATWLSWPHKKESWPGKINYIYEPYCMFIKWLAQSEKVNVNVANETQRTDAISNLNRHHVNLYNINFHLNPTNDAWCRDHGPAFVVNRKENKKAIVHWNYNAWGGKYPPFDLDSKIPKRIADTLNLPLFYPNIVMEGGAVDFNGNGTILTTSACLLHKNRNPNLSQKQIEKYLIDFYGVDQVFWLGDGICGDDTDGHIDDITRFVNVDTVVTAIEKNKTDANYLPLQNNLTQLKSMRLINGKPLNIIELPMPKALIYKGQRLPASYANFYIANHCIIVPTFRDKNDDQAISILQQIFLNHKVVGIDSYDIILGLGSFHCLSQQEPRL